MQPDTMDETTIKREARRRRILENSENRLHKITARQNLDETKGKYNKLSRFIWNIKYNLRLKRFLSCDIFSKYIYDIYINSKYLLK